MGSVGVWVAEEKGEGDDGPGIAVGCGGVRGFGIRVLF